MKAWILRVCVAALLVLNSAAHAAECSIPDATAKVPDYEVALNRLKLDCLGSPQVDKAPIVGRFDGLTNQPINLGQSERLIAAVEALTSVAETRAAGSALHDDWDAMVKELRDVRSRLATLSQVQSKAGWLAVVSQAIPAKWRGVSAGIRQVDLAGRQVDFLRAVGCKDNEPCPDFQSQLDLVRVANLMARLAGYAQSPSLADHYEDARLALTQWEAYRTKALHQYIWEVWANGLAMGEALCPRDAGTGMKMGFCKVPDSQFILLHPEAALRFSNTSTSSSELKAAAVVELFGYYSWRWKEMDGRPTSQMDARWGYSLAATYTNTDAENRWAFGPMLHFGDYSVALTKAGGGGRWSLVLNLLLADRYFGRKQAFVDELQKVKKSSFTDLLMSQ